MAEDYRVPVRRLAVALYGEHGARTEVTLFLPEGQSVEAFFESPDAFFAASEGSNFRLYSRRAITCIEVAATAEAGPELDDGLPRKESKVLVRMVGGMEHRGKMRFIPYEGVTRPVDVLNQAPMFFALHEELSVKYLAKAHIEYVQEERE